jgi:hypothetical protein
MIKAVNRLSDGLLAQVLPKEDASAACGGWRYCGCVWRDSYGSYVALWMRYDTDRGNSCTNCYISGYC